MRRHTKPIEAIVLHCTATRPGRDVDIAEIRRWHVDGNGWDDVGYHYLVRLDGTIETGRPEGFQGAHVSGQNDGTIAVAYAGGVSASGAPSDTRTPAQKAAILDLLDELAFEYGAFDVDGRLAIRVLGHRDFPGVAKACPSFDVAADYGARHAVAAAILTGETDMDTKPFWASKTLWVNAVAIAAAVAGAFSVDLGLDPEGQVAAVAAIMGVVNIVLRLTTDKAVAAK